MSDPVTSSVVQRFSSQEIVKHLQDAQAVLQDVGKFAAGFPKVLAEAEKKNIEGLEPGQIWQKGVTGYWRAWDGLRRRLDDVHYELDVGEQYLYQIAGHLSKAFTMTHDPRNKVRLEYAFDKPHMLDHPTEGSSVAYDVSRLKEWHQALTAWVKEGQKVAKKALTVAKRKAKKSA